MPTLCPAFDDAINTILNKLMQVCLTLRERLFRSLCALLSCALHRNSGMDCSTVCLLCGNAQQSESRDTEIGTKLEKLMQMCLNLRALTRRQCCITCVLCSKAQKSELYLSRDRYEIKSARADMFHLEERTVGNRDVKSIQEARKATTVNSVIAFARAHVLTVKLQRPPLWKRLRARACLP